MSLQHPACVSGSISTSSIHISMVGRKLAASEPEAKTPSEVWDIFRAVMAAETFRRGVNAKSATDISHRSSNQAPPSATRSVLKAAKRPDRLPYPCVGGPRSRLQTLSGLLYPGRR